MVLAAVFDASNTMKQGLVSNGGRYFATALPTEHIERVVGELNQVGKPSNGTFMG